MIRGLWSAASGMKSQQLNIDVISNNLANVNTTSYKKQRAEFKDLLYVSIKRANRNDDRGGQPVNIEVGHGVRVSGTTKDFVNGPTVSTENDFDVAIDGRGFFAVRLPNGEVRYTRDGSFKISVEDGESTLVTSDGYYVLSEDDDVLTIPEGATDINIDEQGYITARDEDGEIIDIGRFRFVDFVNPQGLLSEGSNLYNVSDASGQPVDIEAEDMKSKIRHKFLEGSNVQVVDEMVNMITAQRAYEISSKSIQTADDMLQIANNLRR